MRKLKFANTKSHRPPHIHPDKSTIFLTGRTYAGISWLYPGSAKRYFYDRLMEIAPKYELTIEGYVICNNHYHLLLRAAEGNLVPKFVKHLHGASSRFIRQEIAQFIARHGSVTEYGQILTREITPWDRRQARRLKSASTNKENVVAQFIARRERRLKSASTEKDVIAHFNARSFITDPEVLALLASKEPPIWYQYTDHVIRDEKDYWMHFNYVHQNCVKHGYVKDMAKYQFSSYHRYLKERGKRWLADCFARYSIVDFMPKGIGE